MRAAVLVAALTLGSAAAAAEPAKPRVTSVERVLGRVDPALRPYAGHVAFSASGKHYAYAASADETHEVVVVDGVPGERFDEVRDLRFAGNRLVYRARTGGTWRAFARGALGVPYPDMGELVVSADGAHVAFTARGDDGTVVVFDGKPGPAFDSVQDLQVAGARWIYQGERDRARHAVIDGVVGEALYYVRDLAFSADGKRSAYLANKEGGGLTVVSDATRWPMGADAYGGDVVWTGGGDVLAWWEKRGGTPVVVVEGKATEVVDPFIKVVAVAPRTGTIAYLAEDVRRQLYTVVLDGAERRVGPRHGTVDSLTFSADGARFAYRVWDREGAHWVVDDVVGPAHGDVIHASFSPDGTRVAYHAEDERLWRMVVDGVAGDPSDLYEGIGRPAWSPDGRHLAYFILDGNAAVVLDGERVASITNAVELRWIARGRCVAFGDVRRDGAIVWRVLRP